MTLRFNLVLLCAFPAFPLEAFGQDLYPQIVDVTTYTSSSGAWALEVDPSDMAGKGAADYRMTHDGRVTWSGRFEYTLLHVSVLDDGVVVGLNHERKSDESKSESRKGASSPAWTEWHDWITLIDAAGSVRWREKFLESAVEHGDGSHRPLVRGFVADPTNNRVLERVTVFQQRTSKEVWRIREFSTGRVVGTLEPPFSVSEARPLGSTGLIVGLTGGMNGPRVLVLGPDATVLWDRSWSDEVPEELKHFSSSIPSTEYLRVDSREPRFTVRAAKEQVEIEFEAKRVNPQDPWIITEMASRPTKVNYQLSPEFPVAAATPLPVRELEPINLAVKPLDEHVVFGFESWDFDEAGGFVGIVNERKKAELMLFSAAGVRTGDVSLDGIVSSGEQPQAVFARKGRSWTVFARAGRGPLVGVWAVEEGGRAERKGEFACGQYAMFPLIAKCADGFIALVPARAELSAHERHLVRLDQDGKEVWHSEPFGGRGFNIAANGEGRSAVLINQDSLVQKEQQHTLVTVDAAGKIVRTVQVQEALAALPAPKQINPALILPAKGGGWRVFSMSENEGPRAWNVHSVAADGTFSTRKPGLWRPESLLDPLPSRVDSEGRDWGGSHDALLRFGEAGHVAETVERRPAKDQVGPLRRIYVGFDGTFYLLDAARGDVHVFDRHGSRTRMLHPAPGDGAHGMMSGGPIELAGDGTVYLGLPPPGENPLSSAPNRVAFSPKGDPKRVRANRVSGDAPERWRFAPGTDHMLVLKATSVYLLDGDGKVLSTSARRANRQWLCGIVDASISPDGSFVVLSTSQMRGTARADEYFTLFDKAGKPLRDVPSSLRMSGSGSLWFDGVRALTLGTGQITIIEMTTGKASSIQLPGNHQILLESSVALSPDGREAWLADPDALRVTRFALP